MFVAMVMTHGVLLTFTNNISLNLIKFFECSAIQYIPQHLPLNDHMIDGSKL